MDWARLTRDQVEKDSLPRLCMVCGDPATGRVNKTFVYIPQWVEYLYLAGIFPGVLAQHFFGKQMRVSCPVCDRHRSHWTILVWIASAGWLLAAPFALIGLAIGAAFWPTNDSRTIGCIIAGGAVGLGIWLTVLIRVALTRVKVTKISSAEDEITLERVSEIFAKAVANPKSSRPTS
ncbi:MAG: hypothetical protein ABL888_17865 [Pirellulaceae bacterium]